MTCSTRRGATAAGSSTQPWSESLRKTEACSCTSIRRGAAIGLANKIRAYELQDDGCDTVEANERLGFKPDQRDYGIGAQILGDLGVQTMRLLTNNPRKFIGLDGYGLSVVESVPLEVAASDHSHTYLKTQEGQARSHAEVRVDPLRPTRHPSCRTRPAGSSRPLGCPGRAAAARALGPSRRRIAAPRAALRR